MKLTATIAAAVLVAATTNANATLAAFPLICEHQQSDTKWSLYIYRAQNIFSVFPHAQAEPSSELPPVLSTLHWAGDCTATMCEGVSEVDAQDFGIDSKAEMVLRVYLPPSGLAFMLRERGSDDVRELWTADCTN